MCDQPVKHLVCKNCGKGFTNNRKVMYCSKRCHSRQKNRKAKGLDVSVYDDFDGAIFTNPNHNKTAPCPSCGMEFKVYRHSRERKYCSDACKLTDYKEKAARERWWKAPSTNVYFLKCEECGNQFAARHKGKSICSHRCKLDRQSRARKLSRMKLMSAFQPKQCDECQVMYSSLVMRDNRRFCSTQCGLKNERRIARSKRRAIIRRAFVENVDPTRVFVEQDWVCQICGTKTDPALRATYENLAPELDHIVPLSKGGEHSYANTQCACRECNLAKSNDERYTVLSLTG